MSNCFIVLNVSMIQSFSLAPYYVDPTAVLLRVQYIHDFDSPTKSMIFLLKPNIGYDFADSMEHMV